MESIHGYKVFNSDWTCTPCTCMPDSIIGVCKQYTCPGMFEEDVELDICHAGMHFCKRAVDCFNYYSFNPENKVAEVIAHGEVVEKGDKCCTNKLEIVREVSWSEVLEMVNAGNGCTGYKNSGDCNSGDWNSGDCNSGDWNSGDWNMCNYSSGCFNTVEEKIRIFNQPSEWTYVNWITSRSRRVLSTMPFDKTEWILYSDMTDEEKAAHSESETTGGYLKNKHYTNQDRQNWWRDLPQTDKKEVLAIPNFNAGIFKTITGIDVTL